MATEHIIVETRGRVGLIRLNRPQALNALNSALMRERAAAVDAFEADGNIGCMIITGSEKAFAAGADIKEMADKTFIEAYLGDFTADQERVSTVRKPVIAAVAGFALGGGCELALQCDLIIAADNAKFGQPEIKLGLLPAQVEGVGLVEAMQQCGHPPRKALSLPYPPQADLRIARQQIVTPSAIKLGERAREHPDVGDRKVHTLGAGRRNDMRGIAGQK